MAEFNMAAIIMFKGHMSAFQKFKCQNFEYIPSLSVRQGLSIWWFKKY